MAYPLQAVILIFYWHRSTCPVSNVYRVVGLFLVGNVESRKPLVEVEERSIKILTFSGIAEVKSFVPQTLCTAGSV